jgi:hypothetical protein
VRGGPAGFSPDGNCRQPGAGLAASLTVQAMSDEKPEFGYGRGGRPLWTVRDRDAEGVWEVLRKAGHREFSDRHGGFAVEDGHDGAPLTVACADDPVVSAAELPRYEAALRAAGYRVEPAPDDDQALRTWPPS